MKKTEPLPGDTSCSIAIFGSVARGDSDALSDRDVLIVGSEADGARLVAKHFQSLGWSCTVYTWRRLERAARAGGLFVEHLRREAVILRDPSDRLAHLLSGFRPRPDYGREIGESLRLMRLAGLAPDLPACTLWAMDVLAVAVRSFAVARLANEGVYVFAFPALLKQLGRLELLSSLDVAELGELRHYKAVYRQAGGANVTARCVASMLARLEKGLKYDLRGPRSSVEALTWAPYDASKEESWYLRSRLFEVALWCLRPVEGGEASQTVAAVKKLMAVIRAPSEYGWRFSRQLPELLDTYSRIHRNSVPDAEAASGSAAFIMQAIP